MKRIKQWIAVLLALPMLAVVLAGCGNTLVETEGTLPAISESASADPSSSAAGTHTVVDLLGNESEIPDDLDSILSNIPAFSQIILALGGGEKIVAGSVSQNDLNLAMFPYIKDVITFGQDGVNAESVMEINPDVIVWGSTATELPAGIEELGIPIVRSNISSPDTLMDAVTLMGEVLGGEAKDKAAKYCDFYQGLIDEISALTADIPEEEKPLLYFTASEDGLSSFGIDSMPYHWATVSGARYAGEVSGIQEMRATLTSEQLLALNPDIIICTTKEAQELFLTDATYAGLNAVINKQVYVTPNGGSVWYLGHVEAPLELTWAPTVIWPELADQINTEEKVRYFYETFYGYDLSAEEYNAILNPQ